MTVFLLVVLAITILIISCWLFVRNANVCRIRLKFIDINYGAYNSLPSYYEMLFNPKYQHMWTYNQWVKWINNENSNRK